MDKKSKILVVEDELHIAEGLKLNLTLAGYQVKVCSNGIEAIDSINETVPDLIVLDLMMPKMDGVTFLKEIRKKFEKLPIIVLSAKFEPKNKVECFALGVDDYLSKPFDLKEFLLRIERLLKRSSWTQEILVDTTEKNVEECSSYMFGENSIDFIKGEATNGQKVFNLTVQELKLLKLFISNNQKPLTRKNILEVGWGIEGEVSTRTIDNFIVRFRKYFEEDPKMPVYFKSLRSVGYIFNNEVVL